MHKILLESGITPGGQYRATNIVESVGRYLGSKANKTNINPAITCRKEKGYQNHLIFELVVCFDKDLNLTNCDDVAAGIYGEGASLCPHTKDAHYIVYPQDPDLGKSNVLLISAYTRPHIEVVIRHLQKLIDYFYDL